ncbi:MAG: hypothetical protein R6T89_02650, partial [Candidatus Syntrophosphaera sp.]
MFFSKILFGHGLAGDKTIPAVFEIADKILVPAAGSEDDMGHGHCQGAVLGRFDRQPFVAFYRRIVHARIDGDHGA